MQGSACSSARSGRLRERSLVLLMTREALVLTGGHTLTLRRRCAFGWTQ